jgi:DSF synthase
MNDVVASTLIAEPRHETITHYAGGSADICPSPELTCHYDPKGAVLWSTISPRGVPCFTPSLLHDMERGSQVVEGFFTDSAIPRPLRYIVIRSGIPKVFNVGGDLAYFQRLIGAQDRARLTEYARTAISVTYRNFMAHNLRGVTTIALLEGDALGGGLECALSCDVIIAEEHIKAGFPEILFDMFPGMGGLSFLARRVGRTVVEQMTRSGRQYGARELLDLGVIDQVVPTGEGRDAVLILMRQRENQGEGHASMNSVDKLLRPVTLNELNEVVRLWVDCALRLSARGQQWMRRLHQQQLASFGVANLALVQSDGVSVAK